MADMIEENLVTDGKLAIDLGRCALNCRTPFVMSQDCIADDGGAVAQVMLHFQREENQQHRACEMPRV